MDLSTHYLGMRLPHPLIVGAGPLADELDRVRVLEDAGASLITLRSLYEEEITGEQMSEFFAYESYSDSFAEAGSFAPEPTLALGPDEYLEHLRRIKSALHIPVMASLNGSTPGGWLSFAKLLEEAGANGLELHIFHAASDMTTSAADVERQYVEILTEVKRSVRIPVAVKLAPLFTAFGHFAKQLDTAGADGIVVFTRFSKADIDTKELEIVRSLPLSDSGDLLMRLRGAAALSGRVKASIGITGGVHSGLDVIKATMAGAHATQMVSALLRHGPNHLRRVLDEIEAWMREHEWDSLSEMRGNMSLGKDPGSRGVRTRELQDGTAMKTIRILLAGSLLVIVCALVASQTSRAQAPPAPQAGYAGTDTCLVCHSDKGETLKSTKHGQATIPRSPAATQGCESCHGPGQAHVDDDAKGHIRKFAKITPAETNQTCLTCHNRGDHAAWEGSAHERRNLSCSTCHSVHSPKSAERQLVKATQTEMCATCHRLQVTKTERAVAHMPVREGKMVCTSCHNPHGSISNVKNLKSR